MALEQLASHLQQAHNNNRDIDNGYVSVSPVDVCPAGNSATMSEITVGFLNSCHAVGSQF